MAQAPIVPIGNSKGVRIPSHILKSGNFTDTVHMVLEDDKLIITPCKKKAREGWQEAFLGATKESLIGGAINDHSWDNNEWTW